MDKAQEYWQLVQEVKSYIPTIENWKNDFKSVERKAAGKLNLFLYGYQLEQIRNCGCVDDFLYTLKSITFDKINQKLKTMQKLFTMLPGKMICLHAFSEMYTNDNITDEAAIEILKKSPGHIQYFQKYPDNWKELCGAPANASEGTDPKAVREDELLKKKKPALRKLADKVSSDKNIPEAHLSNGVKGLVKFILDNE